MLLLLPVVLVLNIVAIFSLWGTSNPVAFDIILTILISAKFICFAAGALIGKKRICKALIIACTAIGILSFVACMIMKATLTAVLLALLTIALMVWVIITKYFSKRVEKKV